MVKYSHVITVILGVLAGLAFLTYMLGSINETTTTGSAVQNATNTTLSVTSGFLNLSGGLGYLMGVLFIMGIIVWLGKNFKR